MKVSSSSGVHCTLIGVLIIGACASQADAPPTRWLGSTETVQGVVHVANPPNPVWTADVVRPRLLWSAGAEAQGDARFQGPQKLALGGERLYVLDAMARRVLVFHPADGRLEGAFGREGAGPGEFRLAFGVAYVDGRVVVGDGGKGMLEVLQPDGAYERSIPLGGAGFGLWGTDSGVLVSMLGMGGLRLRHVALDGTSHDVPAPASFAAAEAGESKCQKTVPSGGRLVQTSCFVPTIRTLDLDGTLRRHIQIPSTPQQASREELSLIEAQVRSSIAEVGYSPAVVREMVDEVVADLRIKRPFRQAVYDREGRIYAIWEQAPEELGGGSATLHLLNETGAYVAKLDFDAGWIDFVLHDRTIYALVQDPETGLASLAAYAVDLPASADELGGR